MSGIYDWATPGNLQPEPITEEIWRNLPEEFCRQPRCGADGHGLEKVSQP